MRAEDFVGTRHGAETVLEEKENPEEQQARTERGVCARCGQRVEAHFAADALFKSSVPRGVCPDGKGSYTWAYSRDAMKQLIGALEEFVEQGKQAKQARDAMTADTREVLDFIAEGFVVGQAAFVSKGHSPTRSSLLMHFGELGWEVSRLDAALTQLERDGLIGRLS